MEKSIKILIDWCSFTVHGLTDPKEVIQQYLGLDPDLFTACGSCLPAYREGYSYNNIRICYDARKSENFGDMGIAVSMSGKGCRAFEQSSSFRTSDLHGLEHSAFSVLFQILHERHEVVNITRIDLACDDHNGVLDMEKIREKVEFNEVRSRIESRENVTAWKGRKLAGITSYIGSSASDFFIRFYDKRLERGQLDSTDHWVRCELVLKHGHADRFVDLFVNSDHIGNIVSAILNDKLAFIEMDDSNISRCSVCRWWLDFVDSIDSVQLVSREDAPTTVEQGFEWLKWQVAPWLAIIKRTMGFESFLNLLDFGESKFTSKHHALINDYWGLKVCND